MTNIAYYMECTEYEAGWGCRPDGYIVALSKDVLIDKELSLRLNRNYQEFTDCGAIKLCLITDEMLDKIKASPYNFVWTNNSKSWCVEG